MRIDRATAVFIKALNTASISCSKFAGFVSTVIILTKSGSRVSANHVMRDERGEMVSRSTEPVRSRSTSLIISSSSASVGLSPKDFMTAPSSVLVITPGQPRG